jgi:hypothetical protein
VYQFTLLTILDSGFSDLFPKSSERSKFLHVSFNSLHFLVCLYSSKTIDTTASMEKTPETNESKIEPVVQASSTTDENVEEGNMKNLFTKDEYQLATLGYKQEFFRSLGLFENWQVNSLWYF